MEIFLISSGFLCVLGSESKIIPKHNAIWSIYFLAEITENFNNSVRFSEELWRPFYHQFFWGCLTKTDSRFSWEKLAIFSPKLAVWTHFLLARIPLPVLPGGAKAEIKLQGNTRAQTHGSGVYRQLPVPHEVSCYFFVRWRQDILF